MFIGVESQRKRMNGDRIAALKNSDELIDIIVNHLLTSVPSASWHGTLLCTIRRLGCELNPILDELHKQIEKNPEVNVFRRKLMEAEKNTRWIFPRRKNKKTI